MITTNAVTQQRLLTRALIGTHGELYDKSPSFHAAIYQLARSLPALVDVIAGAGQAEVDLHLMCLDNARLS